MTKERIKPWRLTKKIDETKNYLLEVMNHENFVRKHGKVSSDLKNVEHYLFWVLPLLVVFQFLHLLH